METFYSIQGEGNYQGHAAFFIRLAGCDVGCVWCDVKESWDANKHAERSVESLLQEVKQTAASIVIITGGEPLMYDCLPLTEALQQAGYKTHVETSGAYPLSGKWDWVCVSPKKFKVPLDSVLAQADELKVVVFNKTDIAWALQHAEKVNSTCLLFLQPEWSKEKEMLPLMTTFIQENPTWKLSLQIHKYMGVR
ncbi:MAG: radical SAM protein [Bacteroidetes bacterium]|nr:radical SAM protein [Bacteroidota bacterium]MBK9301354.1 radical SAM protein [Bacteroidota bacterium]